MFCVCGFFVWFFLENVDYLMALLFHIECFGLPLCRGMFRFSPPLVRQPLWNEECGMPLREV